MIIRLSNQNLIMYYIALNQVKPLENLTLSIKTAARPCAGLKIMKYLLHVQTKLNLPEPLEKPLTSTRPLYSFKTPGNQFGARKRL